MEAIILAGGQGTRLRDVIFDIPKPLAPICGKPFLEILIEQLQSCREISKVILAVGYKAAAIISHFEKRPSPLPLVYSFETSPLGTGGALRHAVEYATSDDLLVLNGDSYLSFSWSEFRHKHFEKKADLTIACRYVDDATRFGQVLFDPLSCQVQQFEEKKEHQRPGWVNGGVYLFKRDHLFSFPTHPFSLEREGIPLLLQKRIFSYPCTGTFIDIGTKESYKEAQELLRSLVCSTF